VYLRWEALGERWFGNLCYYEDVRKALTDNPHAMLDAHAFGEVFEAMLDEFGSWNQVSNGQPSYDTGTRNLYGAYSMAPLQRHNISTGTTST
jgi:hypothetical protein